MCYILNMPKKIQKKYISKSIQDTEKIAKELVSLCVFGKKDRATILGLYGELGAGKTTLTQNIAKALGVKEKVLSPTFVIMKIFDLKNPNFKKLIHIDAYRLEDSKELSVLGWNEIINDPTNLVLIEWPEKVADIMPPHTQINLSHIDETSREIEIS